MDVGLFKRSPAGNLLQVGKGEAAYHAFVPHPLPPALPFDAELVRTLSDADRALGELSGLGRTASNPELLVRPFIRREAVLSSRIEGTQADIAALYAYEARQLSMLDEKHLPADDDVREVYNYVRALEYGLERLATLPVSLRLIRELHERLMAEARGGAATPGQFRRSQNWIGRPGCTLNDAEYVPRPVAAMTEALGELEKYLHEVDTYPPLMRLAMIHYQFEAIHPFLDGNGRIGRLLLTLLMVHWGLLSLPVLYLSAYFERNRATYYDLLLAVSQRGAWREWVIFFLRGVSEQANEAITNAKRLQDLQIGWRQRLLKTRALPLAFGITDYLFQQPVVTTADIMKQFDVAHPTAVRSLKQLQKLDILEEVPTKLTGVATGRSRFWLL